MNSTILYSLTFRDFQYLIALAQHKHFGKAAKACFVTQPALSSQIKKIEGYFQKTLFERQNNCIFLTPEGQEVLERVHIILHEAKKLELIFQSLQGTLCTPLKIGIIQTLSPYYTNFFLPQLKASYPLLTLEIKDGYTDELLSDLKEGQLDVLIASSVFSDIKIQEYKLFYEPLFLLVNNAHDLCTENTIDFQSLNPKDMFFLKDGNCLRSESLNLCPQNTRGNIQSVQISSLETLKHMVAFHPSYAVIPALGSTLCPMLQGMVVLKQFADPTKARRLISLFVRKDTPRQRDYDAFFALLKTCLPPQELVFPL